MNPIQSLKDIIGIMQYLYPKTAGIIQEAIDELTNPAKGVYQIQCCGEDTKWCDYHLSSWITKSINIELLKQVINENPDIKHDKTIGYKFRIILINRIETIVYEEKE